MTLFVFVVLFYLQTTHQTFPFYLSAHYNQEELTLDRKERIEFAALGAHPRTTVNVPNINPDEHRAILDSMLHLSPELLEIITL